ncbi:MAG: hypothetical protein WDM96_10725 [Lacunisphaera sp.]
MIASSGTSIFVSAPSWSRTKVSLLKKSIVRVTKSRSKPAVWSCQAPPIAEILGRALVNQFGVGQRRAARPEFGDARVA